MKLFDNGNVKITNRQSVVLNGRKTCLFDVYQLIDGTWEYSGQFDGKTYKEVYEREVKS